MSESKSETDGSRDNQVGHLISTAIRIYLLLTLCDGNRSSEADASADEVDIDASEGGNAASPSRPVTGKGRAGEGKRDGLKGRKKTPGVKKTPVVKEAPVVKKTAAGPKKTVAEGKVGTMEGKKKSAAAVEKATPGGKKTVAEGKTSTLEGKKKSAPVVEKTTPGGKKTAPEGKKTSPVGRKMTLGKLPPPPDNKRRGDLSG